MSKSEQITAAVLVIGDEILSGRTKDTNSGYIAEYLTNIGVDLMEGGIGPTHDDITADAMAAAFNVGIDHNDDAIAMMKAHYPADVELNEARLRMARIPFGASLIPNKASAPPGFKIENVHVMAGVPAVMRAMLDEVGPTLATGKLVLSRTLPFTQGEGTIAKGLGAIQEDFDDVSIGSYPTLLNGKFVTNIVMRGRDEDRLDAAEKAVAHLIETLS